MIIFRSNQIICVAVLLLCACQETTIDAEGDLETEQLGGVEITKGGKSLPYIKFLSSYAANPNAFDDEFFEDDYSVSGFIARLDLYDPYREMYEQIDPDRAAPDYFVPLRSSNPDIDAMFGSPIEVSVSMKNYSREKAGKLSIGQQLSVECEGMSVTGERMLTFDACEETQVDGQK